jgi:predicted site-specific integrase-resolvase
MNQTYSTAQVAAAISVNKSTLLRWLYTGKLKEPRMQIFGGVASRIWTEKDLETAKKHREERYRKRS